MKNIQLTESDEVIIDSLIKSPAFTVLKKVLSQYREVCIGELLGSKDPNKLFEIQGRIIGLNATEKLPEVVADIRRKRLDREADEAKRKDEQEKRMKGIRS